MEEMPGARHGEVCGASPALSEFATLPAPNQKHQNLFSCSLLLTYREATGVLKLITYPETLLELLVSSNI